MITWDYTLPIFLFQLIVISLMFLWKSKGSPNRSRQGLFISILFIYNAYLIYHGSLNSDKELYLALAYTQFVPLVLLIATFYFLPWSLGAWKRKSFKGIIRFEKTQKYGKTGLSKTFSQELKDRLEQLMLTQKPYLNQELRLDDIAKMLNVSRHHASQVINENFGVNFHDYINKYRIVEAMDKLSSNTQNPSRSISEIAYQCGFNNRVSFYKSFRKITHTTPTEYMGNMA